MREEAFPPWFLGCLTRPQRLVRAAPVLLLVDEAMDPPDEAVEAWSPENLGSSVAIRDAGKVTESGEKRGLRLGLYGLRTGRPARGGRAVAWLMAAKGRSGSSVVAGV